MEYSAGSMPRIRHRHQEQDDVEGEDDVADLEHRAALADEQRRDLGAVEHGAAAHRQADAGADEDAAEDRSQQRVVGHVGKVHRRQHQPPAPTMARTLRSAKARPRCR